MSRALRKLNNILVRAEKKKHEKEMIHKNDILTIEEVIKRYEELSA